MHHPGTQKCSKCGAIGHEHNIPLIGVVYATDTDAVVVGGICSDCRSKANEKLWTNTTDSLISNVSMPSLWVNGLPVPDSATATKVLRVASTNRIVTLHRDRVADPEAASLYCDSILVAVSNIVVSAFALADKLGDEVFSGHATRSALTAYNGILGISGIFSRSYPRPTESEIVGLLSERRDAGRTTVVTLARHMFETPVLSDLLKAGSNVELRCRK